MTKKRNTVYSTDSAFKKRCKRCGSFPCRCPKAKSVPPQQQNPRIFRDRKGRGGKTLTVVRGLQLTPDDLLLDRNEKEGMVVQSSNGITIALDTRLTQELLLEGDARETLAAVEGPIDRR